MNAEPDLVRRAAKAMVSAERAIEFELAQFQQDFVLGRVPQLREESFRRLTEAYAALTGQDVRTVRDFYSPRRCAPHDIASDPLVQKPLELYWSLTDRKRGWT